MGFIDRDRKGIFEGDHGFTEPNAVFLPVRLRLLRVPLTLHLLGVYAQTYTEGKSSSRRQGRPAHVLPIDCWLPLGVPGGVQRYGAQVPGESRTPYPWILDDDGEQGA